MEDFALAYGINTVASTFDLTTTAALYKRVKNFEDENEGMHQRTKEVGVLRTVVETEAARRIGFAVIAGVTLGAEKLYSHFTQTPEFPVYAFFLYLPALYYAFHGLVNLIPLVYGNRPNVYVSKK